MNQSSSFASLPIPGVAESYSGKVRDTYVTHDGYFIIVTSDRISAFDHILPKPIPMKGVVLNLMTQHAFDRLNEVVPTWFIESPHPRVLIGYACTRIDVEVVVRGYIAGSLWRAYKAGKREFSWGTLPDGLKENDKLPKIIITPTTKAVVGHDEEISREEIIAQNLCTEEQWEQIEEYAIRLFTVGTTIAAEQGLILVDTKYEFGINQDRDIMVIDEIHTPDSSRFFYRETYEECQQQNLPQRQLSKEFVREELMSLGFEGKEGQKIPDLPDAFIGNVAGRYHELLDIMTSQDYGNLFNNINDIDNPDLITQAIAECLNIERAKKVLIVMGSESDYPVMKKAAEALSRFGIGYDIKVVSAHRTPHKLANVASNAASGQYRVIIAGAGGAAHLPGMMAAYTPLPVIGVPIKSSNSIDGWDSVLSILQMPKGVPVATVALDGAENAGILAVQILGASDSKIQKLVHQCKMDFIGQVSDMNDNVQAKQFPVYTKNEWL